MPTHSALRHEILRVGYSTRSSVGLFVVLSNFPAQIGDAQAFRRESFMGIR